MAASDHRARLDASDALGNQLVQVGRFMARNVPRWVEASGMEGSGFRLLAQLVVNGPQSVGALAQTFGLDRSTVSSQLADLTAAGLIERYPGDADRRVQMSAATSAGRSQFRAVRSRRSEALASRLEDWSLAEIRSLVDLLGRLTSEDRLPFEPFASSED